VFGTGPGLFGHYYVVGVREGWAFRGQPLPPSGMPWVHSVPIEILCETGLASAAAYAAAVFAGVRRLCRGLRRATQDREWLVALSTSVACFGVMSLVDMSFIKDWVRVVFWLLLGLCFASKQPWPTANATTHTTPEAQSPTTKTRSGRRGREAYKSG
jgi:O-antigen ligase